MPAPRRPRLSLFLHPHRLRMQAMRSVALALLLIGMVLNPMLAAACQIDDIGDRMSGQHPSVSNHAPAQDGQCCPMQGCSACCAHVAVFLPALDVVSGLPAGAGVLPVLSIEFEPTAYPVPVRPPIRG